MSSFQRATLPGAGRRSSLGNDRRQTLIGAVAAAVLAVVVLAIALSGGNKDDKAAAPAATDKVTVLVATETIRQGSLLDKQVTAGAIKAKTVTATDVRPGAVATVEDVRGKVAQEEILPGEQVVATALTADKGTLASRLTARERGVSLPIDRVHGMVGDIEVGDHVDVYSSFNLQVQGSDRQTPVLKVLAQDVTVLRTPKTPEGGEKGPKGEGQLTLNLNAQTAAKAAFTADWGKVWIVARPAAGSKNVKKPDLVTLESVLLGVKPIIVTKNLEPVKTDTDGSADTIPNPSAAGTNAGTVPGGSAYDAARAKQDAAKGETK